MADGCGILVTRPLGYLQACNNHFVVVFTGKCFPVPLLGAHSFSAGGLHPPDLHPQRLCTQSDETLNSTCHLRSPMSNVVVNKLQICQAGHDK